MFRYFKHRKILKAKARLLYQEIVAQSHQPTFYQDLSVPDSVDGRFELIALHCYIVIHRLNQAGASRQAQALFDVFFINMDQSLREMGIGDVGVPKHMKRMMQGFNGRMQNYENSIADSDREALKQALIRNLYGTIEAPTDGVLSVVSNYVRQSAVMDMKMEKLDFAEIDLSALR